MIDFKLDLSKYVQASENLGYAIDQVPFALSRAMNDAAKVTREKLITDTWPSAVTVRSAGFMRAALRTEFANKYNLEIKIYDKLGHGNLAAHAKGGIKVPKGTNIAIPMRSMIPYGKSSYTNNSPRAIVGRTPKRALRITPTGIFVGVGGHLKLAYKLQPSAEIKKDVPFIQDFERFMREEIDRMFPQRMYEAMRTRR